MKTIELYATDDAGAVGNRITISFLYSPQPPVTPTLLMNPAEDTGILGDNITIITQPHFIGVTDPGIEVRLLDGTGSVIAGPIFSSPDGSFSFQFPNPSGQLGNFSVQVRASNLIGSSSSPLVNFTIKSPGPDTPPNLKMLPADDSGVKGDNLTNVTRPRFSGVTDAGVTVELLDGNGNSFSPGHDNQRLLHGCVHAPVPEFGQRKGRSRSKPGQQCPGFHRRQSAHLHDRHSGPTQVPTLNINPDDDSGIKGDAITNVVGLGSSGRSPRPMPVRSFDSTKQTPTAISPALSSRPLADSNGNYSFQLPGPKQRHDPAGGHGRGFCRQSRPEP